MLKCYSVKFFLNKIIYCLDSRVETWVASAPMDGTTPTHSKF